MTPHSSEASPLTKLADYAEHHLKLDPDFAWQILDSLPVALLILDRNLRVETANLRFHQYFSVTPENAKKQLLREFGKGIWNDRTLLDLLNRFVHEDIAIVNFELDVKTPALGRRTFVLDAKKIQASRNRETFFLVSFEDVTDRKKLEEEMRHLALTDSLTGLSNRRSFDEALDDAAKSDRRFKQGTALLLLDLDGFKAINDTYGHPVGDALLMRVAMLLSKGLRETDKVARFGGDEFAIILKGIKDIHAAKNMAQHYAETLCQPLMINNHEVSVSCSIGVAHLSVGMENAVDLLRHADRALYRAKKKGGNTYSTYR